MGKRFWIVIGRAFSSIARAVWIKAEPILDFIGKVIALAMCAIVFIAFLIMTIFMKKEAPQKQKSAGAGG